MSVQISVFFYKFNFWYDYVIWTVSGSFYYGYAIFNNSALTENFSRISPFIYQLNLRKERRERNKNLALYPFEIEVVKTRPLKIKDVVKLISYYILSCIFCIVVFVGESLGRKACFAFILFKCIKDFRQLWLGMFMKLSFKIHCIHESKHFSSISFEFFVLKAMLDGPKVLLSFAWMALWIRFLLLNFWMPDLLLT